MKKNFPLFFVIICGLLPVVVFAIPPAVIAPPAVPAAMPFIPVLAPVTPLFPASVPTVADYRFIGPAVSNMLAPNTTYPGVSAAIVPAPHGAPVTLPLSPNRPDNDAAFKLTKEAVRQSTLLNDLRSRTEAEFRLRRALQLESAKIKDFFDANRLLGQTGQVGVNRNGGLVFQVSSNTYVGQQPSDIRRLVEVIVPPVSAAADQLVRDNEVARVSARITEVLGQYASTHYDLGVAIASLRNLGVFFPLISPAQLRAMTRQYDIANADFRERYTDTFTDLDQRVRDMRDARDADGSRRFYQSDIDRAISDANTAARQMVADQARSAWQIALQGRAIGMDPALVAFYIQEGVRLDRIASAPNLPRPPVAPLTAPPAAAVPAPAR